MSIELTLKGKSVQRLYNRTNDINVVDTALNLNLITADEYGEITGAPYVTTLAKMKKAKIAESKTALEAWLVAHPLTSTAHNNVSGTYTVTEDKQTQLALNLMSYQLATQVGVAETLTWNETGKECEVWTATEITQLLFEIKAYVKPRISEQQGFEAAINECETVEAVQDIAYNYDTCPHAHQ